MSTTITAPTRSAVFTPDLSQVQDLILLDETLTTSKADGTPLVMSTGEVIHMRGYVFSFSKAPDLKTTISWAVKPGTTDPMTDGDARRSNLILDLFESQKVAFAAGARIKAHVIRDSNRFYRISTDQPSNLTATPKTPLAVDPNPVI